MPTSAPIDSFQVSEQFLATKCDYFVDVQLWPLTHRMSPRRWLNNFLPEEKEHARHLLNAFIYFSQPLMDQLLLSTFQSISRFLRDPGESFLATQQKWREFCDGIIVTCVRGEVPNPTDSGYMFLRMARQILGIDEGRIMEPKNAITALAQHTTSTVIFFDDFVGSGEQFIQTWKHRENIPGLGSISFELLASVMRGASFIYCPLICTEHGRQRISASCPSVRLHPAHLLTTEYNAFSADCVFWPSNLQASVENFLKCASDRAGITEWKGFHELGLTIAFEHSVPDATLPIFYWQQNGWYPLIQRT